jgi:hypothetical protein
MSIAPFIRPIQTQGGTFYTFTSATEDLSLTFNNSGKKFTFSKYALLNLPNIARPTADAPNEENVIQLDTIPGAFQYVSNSKTYNQMFAESLQNYTLNLETMVTSFPTYDSETLQTVSERVFFKWLKETGALRFTEASTSQAPLTAGLRFTEEESSIYYNPVVKYVGDIDIVNSLKSTADAYSEIYINVPTKDGATPLVLFKSTQDVNYYPGQNLINSPIDPLNTEFLFGRDYNQVNPAGLDVHAFFDSDFQNYGIGATPGATASNLPVLSTPGDYQLLKYDTVSGNYEVNWWFPYPEANSFWTQPAAASGSFDDWGSDSFKIIGVKEGSVNPSEITFRRSRLDGIGIDFNPSNYVPIATNPSLKGFSDFNSIPESVSFEFNTVLIYYDVEDISTGNSATNLFGVLFLDDVKDTLTGGSFISRLKKYKPNRITGLNGNSYGFKVNLKFDTNTTQAAIVSSVNEYAPFSLHVFLDALNRMQTTTQIMLDNQNKFLALQLQFNQLSDIVTGGSEITAIYEQLANIKVQLDASKLMFENSEEIMTLLQKNNEEILNIYQNKTSVAMSYDTSVIKQGSGIEVDKTVPNQVTIVNTSQEYNIPTNPIHNILTSFTPTTLEWQKILPLNDFTNYLKLSNGITTQFNRDVGIYIDDSITRWKKGQVLRIVIDSNFPMDMYTLGSFDLVVYTDALDRTVSGTNYNIEIGRIFSSDFLAAEGSPRIEIICIDPATYTFTFDLKY